MIENIEVKTPAPDLVGKYMGFIEDGNFYIADVKSIVRVPTPESDRFNAVFHLPDGDVSKPVESICRVSDTACEMTLYNIESDNDSLLVAAEDISYAVAVAAGSFTYIQSIKNNGTVWVAPRRVDCTK